MMKLLMVRILFIALLLGQLKQIARILEGTPTVSLVEGINDPLKGENDPKSRYTDEWWNDDHQRLRMLICTWSRNSCLNYRVLNNEVYLEVNTPPPLV